MRDLPTGSNPAAKLPDSPPCVFCDSRETELVSAFGSHASVSGYWCRSCRTPFEYLRWSGSGRRETAGTEEMDGERDDAG
jgi:hypothetical protein